MTNISDKDTMVDFDQSSHEMELDFALPDLERGGSLFEDFHTR